MSARSSQSLALWLAAWAMLGCAGAADCEPTTPHCCEGRCVVAGWMYVETAAAESVEPAAEPEEAQEPPCVGMDCFGGYQPKTSPDTLADVAPLVVRRVDEIARAGRDRSPALR